MKGQIVKIHLKTAHKQPMVGVETVQAESGMGFVGDASYGRSKRQVLVIEQETLDEFGLESGQVRENLTVSGIALAGKPAGMMIQAGEVLFEITGDCAPCHFLEEIQEGLKSEIDGRRGTLCRVIDGGTVKVGDPVELV